MSDASVGQLLYVEDEPDLRRSVLRVLHQTHQVVREATCVYEARVLVATGEVAAELANACARRGVTYVVKPFGVPELERFVERASRFDTERGALDEGLRVLADKTRMTEREHEVLRLAVMHGFGHAPIADALGITRHTVKTHIRRVLRKSGTRSLDLLRARFRR